VTIRHCERSEAIHLRRHPSDIAGNCRAVPLATAHTAETKMDCFVTAFLAMTLKSQDGLQ
jgi:hypothetical protein